jgi:LmbE family N-acetylglucosaminyl deacetylase
MTGKTILAVLAHPDDETLGFGGTLARYADLGADTHLVCATRGQRGWFGEPDDYPGPEALGRIRKGELMEAAQVLNLKSVCLLDYMDGELDQVDPETIIGQIATQIQRIRPQVVVTFDPNGIYGHPDHIAISQFAAGAIVAAADGPVGDGMEPHRVDAFYYRVMTEEEVDAYQAAFGDLVMTIDGVERRTVAWPEWGVTHLIDACDYVPQVWEAVRAHRSQLPGYERLMALSKSEQDAIFGTQTFCRAFSLTAGGRERQTELFDGVMVAEQG